MAISRYLPRTISGRLKAIQKAKSKKDSGPPSGNFLTTATNDRLDAIVTAYTNAKIAIAVAKANQAAGKTTKEQARGIAYIYTRHFLMTIMMAVERKETDYSKSVLAYYSLSTENPVLPDMNSDGDLIFVAENTFTGDNLRTGAGGPALPMPTVLQVETFKNDFKTASQAFNNMREETDNKEEALAALNPEADAVIKKVWDEVETFYNEEEAESKRANARLWGTIYIRTDGDKVTISGTAVNDSDETPLENVEIGVAETEDSTTSAADGTFSFKTNATGTVTLQGTLDDFNEFEEEIELPDAGGSVEIQVRMVPV